MKIGIIGLPNVGKSTLFKALTKNEVDTSNYPFATIEPNVGVVAVPDIRLDKLARLSKSKKIVPAIVEFVDIAGLVKGANKGEGLGNKFLHNIREVDAILEVVRVFEKTDVTHVEGSIDPKRDMEIIMTELILKDLDTIDKHIPKIEKMLKGSDKKEMKKNASEIEAFKSLREKLQIGVPAYKGEDEELAVGKTINLLTAKPFMYVLNGDHQKMNSEELPKNSLIINIQDELDMSSFSEKEIAEMGAEFKLDEIIKKAYELLDLISFFTTGEDETRAWTIRKGSTAKEAGGAIHSDFEEKFIRAEIIFWEKLIGKEGWSNAKNAGILRLEGKNYIVEDGDVIEFKI